MEKPRCALISIVWIDEKNVRQERNYSEEQLEDAQTLLGLMSGDIVESDLED